MAAIVRRDAVVSRARRPFQLNRLSGPPLLYLSRAALARIQKFPRPICIAHGNPQGSMRRRALGGPAMHAVFPRRVLSHVGGDLLLDVTSTSATVFKTHWISSCVTLALHQREGTAQSSVHDHRRRAVQPPHTMGANAISVTSPHRSRRVTARSQLAHRYIRSGRHSVSGHPFNHALPCEAQRL
jgi:hypothetical protein